jgi:N-carbamoyl-L-amino-acid hydrolase
MMTVTRSTFTDNSTFDPFASAQFLFRELEHLSFDGTGITRESYSTTEEAAFGLMKAFAERHGLRTETDPASNLFITLPGLQRTDSCVLCGSHLDSVPHGGNYDGAAGVVAALICLCKMRSLSIVPNKMIKLVVLRAEEGAWFGKPCIGSSALLGQLRSEDLSLKHYLNGLTLRETMKRAGAKPELIELGLPLTNLKNITAYFELHIEQGPVLEKNNRPVAIVSGIRGNFRHKRIACIGEPGHSGAVPQYLRHDAVLATADLLIRVEQQWIKHLNKGDDLVVTTGVVSTNPADHSSTRIPGEVFFSLDIRSQDEATLTLFHHWIIDESRRIEIERGVRFEFGHDCHFSPVLLDKPLISRLGRLCERLELDAPVMPSGAGHDAAIFSAAGIPSAMIFVRNQHGSHNPSEAMDLEDFVKGAHLLYEALLEAAND